jgi:hypothetical protein
LQLLMLKDRVLFSYSSSLYSVSRQRYIISRAVHNSYCISTNLIYVKCLVVAE